MKTLRLLLGDQLNIKHPWLKEKNDDVIYCLFEMRQETDYVLHHIQKVIGFFAAMRQFSEDIQANGHQVVYYKINDKENTQELTKNLNQLIQKHNIQHFEYQYPDEYRLDKQLRDFCKDLEIESSVISTHHFYTDRKDVKNFFEGKKQYLMETFYRDMRKKHDILMQNVQPEGGKWNYDKSNRNKWNGDVPIPAYKYFKNNVDEVVKDIEKANIKTFGNFATKTFGYPITRKQSLEQLKFFCEELLQHFGDYQDAMHTDEAYLFHSRLSFAMNLKLISPKDVVKTVENYYNSHHKSVDISQVEGFIRQIIGWREYMRGMYWALMPKFKKENTLKHKNKLASFYWDADTKMNCLKHSIQNSLDNGYAHHIQRLMITGNYALLTQTDPDEVDDWYLGIYVDAVEWVQLPNTRGMSQFADGGRIATKPYVSSGSYINKMSNYCGSCYYSKTKKTGDKACPFNSLYWNFLDDHRKTLSDNHRMTMMYSLLDKMKPKDLKALKQKAQHIIEHQSSY
ncbi:MAG: cryptochrome/photolyase family protein [Gelidibacter sp.]